LFFSSQLTATLNAGGVEAVEDSHTAAWPTVGARFSTEELIGSVRFNSRSGRGVYRFDPFGSDVRDTRTIKLEKNIKALLRRREEIRKLSSPFPEGAPPFELPYPEAAFVAGRD